MMNKPSSSIRLSFPQGLFLTALLLRCIWLLAFSSTPFNHFLLVDARTYDEMAKWILENGWFTNHVFERAPLYPFFVAAIYTIFSPEPLWIRVVQIVLGSLNVLLIYYWIRNFLNESIAKMGGVIAASYGMFIYHETDVLAPTLGIFFLLLFLYASTKNENYQWKWSIIESNRNYLAAISLSFATATIPTLIFAAPYLFLQNQWKPIKEKWKHFILYSSLIISLPLLIVSYQWLKFQEPIFSLQGGVNLYIGNNATADGYTAEIPKFGAGWTFEEVKHRLEVEKGKQLKWSDVDKHYRSLAIQFWLSEPIQAIKLTIKKIGYLLYWKEISNTFDIHQFIREFRWSRWLLLVGWWIIAPLAITGFVLSTTKKYRNSFPLLISLRWTVFAFVVSMLVFFINARYRLPLVPLLIPYAALAVYSMVEYRNEKIQLLKFIPLLGFGFLMVWTNFNRYSDDHGSFGKMQMALALKEEGNYLQAEEKFIEAYRAQPDLPGVQYELSNLALLRQDSIAARKWILGELKNANDPRNELNIATILAQLNELEVSKIILERALTKNPSLEQGWRNLWRVEFAIAQRSLMNQDTLIAVEIYKKLENVSDPIFRQVAKAKLDSLLK